MESFFPCPPPLRDTIDGFLGANTPEQAALEAKKRSNELTFGHANWYDWCVEEWGTKWDVGKSDIDDPAAPETPNSITLSFQSAWSPPFGFYDKMHGMGFSVRAMYFEPGVGFCGSWDNGLNRNYRLQVDDKADLERLEREIPTDLQEAFNILAFYDEEELA